MGEGGVSRVRYGDLDLDSADLDLLISEARLEGHHFVDRMVRNWANGINRFERPGEAHLAAFQGDQVVGIGGLNVDPYQTDRAVGRLRHVYVCPDYRRLGIARELVERVIAVGAEHFARIRLRTDNPAAASLYEALGFLPIDEDNATHALDFR